MRYTNLFVIIGIVLVVGIGLSGCGGGGGSSGVATASSGVVTGFGSVYLDGTRFDSSSAAISVDDSAGVEDQLRVGMKVRIQSSGTTASVIEYDKALEGPIASIDAPSSTLVVLGVTILVDPETVIKDESGSRAADAVAPALTLADLAVGQMVEASGFTRADGVLVASRVERSSDTFVGGVTLVEISGFVSGLVEITSTFTLGTLTIDYSGVATPPVGLIDGVPVEVRGTISAPGATTLLATDVDIEDLSLQGSSGEEIHIHGFVTALASTTEFEVDGQPVDASSAEYRDGAPEDLALGIRVEVEGSMVGSVLVASEVEFHAPRVQLEGQATAVSATGITVMGVDVVIDAGTELPGGLPSVSADVRVRASVRSGVVVADLIEAATVSENLLEGPVTAPASPDTFDILGVTVDTSALTDAAFKQDDVIIGRSAFYAALTAGQVVQVSGIWAAGTMTAAEVELED